MAEQQLGTKDVSSESSASGDAVPGGDSSVPAKTLLLSREHQMAEKDELKAALADAKRDKDKAEARMEKAEAALASAHPDQKAACQEEYNLAFRAYNTALERVATLEKFLYSAPLEGPSGTAAQAASDRIDHLSSVITTLVSLVGGTGSEAASNMSDSKLQSHVYNFYTLLDKVLTLLSPPHVAKIDPFRWKLGRTEAAQQQSYLHYVSCLFPQLPTGTHVRTNIRFKNPVGELAGLSCDADLGIVLANASDDMATASSTCVVIELKKAKTKSHAAQAKSYLFSLDQCTLHPILVLLTDLGDGKDHTLYWLASEGGKNHVCQFTCSFSFAIHIITQFVSSFPTDNSTTRFPVSLELFPQFKFIKLNNIATRIPLGSIFEAREQDPPPPNDDDDSHSKDDQPQQKQSGYLSQVLSSLSLSSGKGTSTTTSKSKRQALQQITNSATNPTRASNETLSLEEYKYMALKAIAQSPAFRDCHIEIQPPKWSDQDLSGYEQEFDNIGLSTSN